MKKTLYTLMLSSLFAIGIVSAQSTSTATTTATTTPVVSTTTATTTATTTSTSTATTTATTTSLVCNLDALLKREDAIIAAYDVKSAAVKAALTARRESYKTIFLVTDKSQREEARKIANKNFKSARKTAERNYEDAVYAARKVFITTVKNCVTTKNDKKFMEMENRLDDRFDERSEKRSDRSDRNEH